MADNLGAGSDFEIGDVESFSSGKDEQFSHSLLAMSIMRRCIDSGSQEMKAGYFQTKSDKMGNEVITYIEDSRKKHIASIQTAINIMICDFDEEAEKNINNLLKEIKEKKRILAEENESMWMMMSNEMKYKNPHMKGFITHPFLQDLMTEYQLEKYREILSELTKLTKRIDFYKAEMFEA